MKAQSIILSAIVISILLAQVTFAALPRYKIIDLGTLVDSWHFSVAYSINNFGQIVGECENWDTHITRATLFDSSGSGNNIDLGTLGGTNSRAWCINDIGQIVGTADVIIDGAPRGRATLFDPSGGANNIDLGTLGGLNSEAFSVNKLGQIVGRAALPSISRSNAVIFDISGAANNIDLGTLGGNDSSSLARSINNSGQIVGLGISREPNHTTFRSAALFDPTGGGQNIDLATLGGPESGTFSINDAGQIVGWVEFIYGDEYGWHATLFDPSGGGNNIDLDPFAGPGDYSWAWSINNKGRIVGTIQPGGSNPRATLFDPSGAGNNIDLNTLINSSSEWTLRYARSINDSGWIVGEGVNPDGQPRAFLLIPKLIIYVDDDAAGANDGSSWADAYNYLQDALSDAYSGDEIHVSQGIYKPDRGAVVTPGDREETFQLINSVTLKGGYAGYGEPDPNARDIELYETILSGDLDGNDIIDVNYPWGLWNEPTRAENSYHVVTGSGTDQTPVLDGFTITAGNANGPWPDSRGGGMYNFDCSPTLIKCTFNSNSAYLGGAMDNYQSSPTIIDCTFNENESGGGSGMVNEDSSPTVINCTFSCNSAHGTSVSTAGVGGMYNYKSNPTITNCTFSDNFGGGMVNYKSSPILTNCTFNGNSADWGGGIYNVWSSPTLAICTFSGNSASCTGGGIQNEYSDTTVTGCMFTGNSACFGGGMSQDSGDVKVTHCTFSNNIADYGGGMINLSSLTLTNCTFTGNSAVEGGGLFNNYGTPAINNCTFSGNSAELGGGIYCYYSESSTMTNCILWGNTADSGSQIALDNSYNQSISYCDIRGGWPGQGNIDVDPLFVDPGYWDTNGAWTDGNYHLLLGSPCIDAGDPNYIPEPNETDLDGKPRVIGGRIDMGAYELPIFAQARILPRTINLASKGKSITCYIWLPDEYEVTDIEPNSVFFEDEIQPEQFSVDEHKQVATATFDREKVQGILNVGDIELTITCQLTDGTYFEATDIIQVTDKGTGK